MKKSIILALLIFTSINFVFSLDSNVVWSTNIWPVNEIFNHPDSNFIFINQNQLKRFSKIDTRTGVIVDSVYNKGMVVGISSNNKYLYTRGGTLESIKKLDINTYKSVDSIPNIGDASAVNPHFPPGQNVSIRDFKFTSNNQIFVTLQYGKYLIIVLDANNLEIINKKLTHLVSDSLSGAGSISISPKNDICVIQQQYQSFEQVPEPKHWQKTVVWDMQKIQPTNKILTEESTVGNNFQIFTFSPDGKYFFFRFDKLRIYDTKDFNLIKSLGEYYGIDFTLDYKYFALDGDPNLNTKYTSEIKYFDLTNLSQVCSQNDKTEIGSDVLKFSTNNKFIILFDVENNLLLKLKTCTDFTDIKGNYFDNTALKVSVQSNNLLVFDSSLSLDIVSFQIIDILGENIKTEQVEIKNGLGIINIKNLQSRAYFLIINNISYKFMIVR